MCVPPVHVRRAAAILAGTDVKVGTVVGFPHGYSTTAIKVAETRQALADGATEIDMVLQIGALKSGRDADVQADIAAVVEVAHAAGAIVKVIFENAYLTDDEKIRACRLTEAAGADFVKTSTGFAPSGATHDDLRLMRANTSPHVQVKAAGGVRTLDALLEVMALGVDAHRRDGHEADHRRLPRAQGRRRAGRRRERRGRLVLMSATTAAPVLTWLAARRAASWIGWARPRPTRWRPPASGAPMRSPRTAWSTCSGPVTRASRSRRCSRATARTRASTRSSSCR